MEDGNGVTVVMYHYVRPLSQSRYPRIKARQLADFDTQLEFLQSNYQILSMDEFLHDCANSQLPERAAILTFDDGFIDHYTYVLPRLMDRGLKAAFYPAASPMLNGTLLDVHRIHFILAAARSIDEVTAEMESLLSQIMPQEAIDGLRDEWSTPNAFDSGEVLYVKRILQVGLPRALRNDLSAQLFAKFVSADERAFAEELYMNLAQLRMMRELGMHIGSHAHTHEWMSRLTEPEQDEEIQVSLDMLRSTGLDPDTGWTIAFPYGDHNACSRELLKAAGCSAAFTTEHRVAHPGIDGMLSLPRIDTASLRP